MPLVEDDVVRRAKERTGVVLRDKWRLDRVLGVGGMAAVYSATHRNGQRAAVKVLHPEAALVPSIRSRFLHEGYLANTVGHSGAVSILDDDADETGAVFLVMELLDGETLEGRLDRVGGKLDVGEVLCIADQVLACLCAAHARGVVHRDLKPGNLFVTCNGIVKLLDFGIARLEAENSVRHGTEAQALGTPGFMPPEQARGHWDEVDGRSDLWAIGAVMFAAITGRFVHEAPTLNEQLLAAMTEPAAPLKEFEPDVADSVARVVDRALEFDPRERWADASEMRHAVREAYLALTGCPISEAPSLEAPHLRSDPVDLSAPTFAPVRTPTGEDPTTSRPVARGHIAPRPGFVQLALPLGVAAFLVAIYLTATSVAALRVDPSQPPVEPASARTELSSVRSYFSGRETARAERVVSPRKDAPVAAVLAISKKERRSVRAVKRTDHAAPSASMPEKTKASSVTRKGRGADASLALTHADEIDIFARRK